MYTCISEFSVLAKSPVVGEVKLSLQGNAVPISLKDYFRVRCAKYNPTKIKSLHRVAAL